RVGSPAVINTIDAQSPAGFIEIVWPLCWSQLFFKNRRSIDHNVGHATKRHLPQLAGRQQRHVSKTGQVIFGYRICTVGNAWTVLVLNNTSITAGQTVTLRSSSCS